jgi:hypothetical protein
VKHSPEGLAELIHFLGSFTDPDKKADMACIIETNHELLISALLEAGFSVYPVNPKTVDRLRRCAGSFEYPFSNGTVNSTMSNSLASRPMERWIGKESESTIGTKFWNGCPKESAQVVKHHIHAVRFQWLESCAEPKVRIRDLLTKPAGKRAESTLTEPTGV